MMQVNINEETCTHRVRHLYIHVPFCPVKCSYCAFVTHIGSLKLAEPYVEALRVDAARLAKRRGHDPLQTVYFGGGTPTMLTPSQIERVLMGVGESFGIADGAEITMEGHPATVSSDSLFGYVERGINRMSFGVETLHSGELASINRGYDPETVGEVVRRAREAGVRSVALDLIYGLPGQTPTSWRDTLALALEIGPDHLSLYPLAIEPQTVFARRRKEGRLPLPTDDTVVRMYHDACQTLASAGFEHYEVSNWALPGHASRHNTAYWRNEEFYALGAGAHAYVHPMRTANVRQTRRYIDLVKAGQSPVAETDKIAFREIMVETAMLNLRLLREGLDTHTFERRFGVNLLSRTDGRAVGLLERGLLRLDGSTLLLPEHEVPLANEVWAEFM